MRRIVLLSPLLVGLVLLAAAAVALWRAAPVAGVARPVRPAAGPAGVGPAVAIQPFDVPPVDTPFAVAVQRAAPVHSVVANDFDDGSGAPYATGVHAARPTSAPQVAAGGPTGVGGFLRLAFGRATDDDRPVTTASHNSI